MSTQELQAVPSATHLVFAGRPDDETRTEWKERGEPGTCVFCAHEGPTVQAEEVINRKYFNNDDYADAPYSDRVCVACAYCMGESRVKQAHWIATEDDFERVSTGDLRDLFNAIEAGESDHDPPLALKIADDPIRSSHAYLWTPVSYTTDPLRVCYDRSAEEALVEWGLLDQLIEDIEELRWHGCRLDDIRAGDLRAGDLESVGRAAFDRIRDRTIRPHSGTALFEIAITLSRAADDQDRDETTDGNATLSKFA